MGIVTAIRDGLANIVSGAGTTADKRSAAFYALRHVDPAQIEAAYRSSWLMRKIIDVPAYDETREWRIWQADETEIEKLEAEEKRLQLRHKVRRARVLARLHGGGAIMLGVGADIPEQPLDPAKVKAGDLRYAHVFSRWELSHGQKRQDPEDPWFGQPLYFEIRSGAGTQVRVHPSRIVAFVGQPAPEASHIGAHSWFWGDPLMQSIDDAVKNADMAQNGFASLIDEASIDIFSIPDLMANVGSTEYEQRMLQRLSLSKLGQSMHRAKLMDANEKWETRQLTWSGMPEIIQSYLQLVSGAADIPVTRLLGQSPAGMNSTGESDLRNYYDSVSAKQENDLRPLLDRIDDVLLPSVFGKRPADIWYDFAPLWQMSPKEKAEVDKAYADIAESDARSGLLPADALAAGRRGRVIEDGIYPGIEAALEKVDAELAANPEEDDDDTDPNELQAEPPLRRAANDGTGGAPTGGRPFVDGKRRRNGRSGGRTGSFDPLKHPRGPGGKFASTGGGKREGSANQFVKRALGKGSPQKPHVIARLSPRAALRIEAAGVKASGKSVSLDHGYTRHAMKSHAGASEKPRGQVPITSGDLGKSSRLIERASYIGRGNPPASKNGAPRIEITAIDGGFYYEAAFEVRKWHVVPITMYKRVLV